MTLLTKSSISTKPKNLGQLMIAFGVAIALLYVGRVLIVTLVIAITIAFLLDPFVELLMKIRLPRSVASFLVCSFALLVIYLVGLGAYAQISVFFEDAPTYSARINELVGLVSARLERAEKSAYDLLVPQRDRPRSPEAEPDVEVVEQEAAERRRRSAEPPMPAAIPEVRIREERPMVNYVFDYVRSVYDALLMASFVPFLVYFMLSWRDHVRRSYLQLFEGQDRHAAGRSWEGIADMARAYVLGNFALGVFLGVVSSVFFWAIRLPYFLLIGPLSGFLSLIPYVGLPLAIIPPFFVAITVYDVLTPFLIIAAVVGFLHLLALNLLYPKLVGAKVHLNPLAVTVALMFFGLLWGGIGLVLAIPVTAGVKAVFDNVPNLQAYGKLLGD